jgi:hypothetical protein
MQNNLYSATLFFINGTRKTFHNINNNGLIKLERYYCPQNNIAYFNVFSKLTKKYVNTIYVLDVFALNITLRNGQKIQANNIIDVKDYLSKIDIKNAYCCNVFNKKENKFDSTIYF